MKFVSPLTEADRTALEKAHRGGTTHRQRQRAQAILFSAKGFTLEQIALACDVHRDTVSGWLDQWQAYGLRGLQDAPKTGRPPKVDALIKDYLHEMLTNPSPHMKALVLDELRCWTNLKKAVQVTCSRPTVLVLDNATVHRAKLVQVKRREWKQKGLRLLFLPPYCPHFNKIEVLWRQIKYCWLAPEAYTDFTTLCQSVTDILAQVGTKYRISFA